MWGRIPGGCFVCEGLEPRTLLAAIVSNSTTPGAISVRGEFDSYEFDAAVGERVVLSVGEVTAAYEPYVELRGPDGGVLFSDFGANSAFIEAVATAAGTYSARVHEYGNDETGDYLLHFAKLPHSGAAANPFDADGGVIASNSTTAASVEAPGDFDLYQFDAAAGERIILSLAEVTAAYEPYLAVYGPDGAKLGAPFGANSAFFEGVAATGGTYTALVFEYGNDERGDYLLHYAKLPHAGPATNPADGDGTVLASNSTTAASVDAPGDFDLYLFEAAAGERIILSLAEVTAAYEPYLAVYGPGGAMLGGPFGATSAFFEGVAATAGTYAAVVFEYGNDEAGDYRLHYVKVPHAGPAADPFDGDGAVIVSNTTTAASIEAAGDLDLYSFDAAAGERVVLSLGEVTATYEPYLALYGPAGQALGAPFGTASANIELVAPATGTYYALVGEYGNDEPGEYRLHYAKLPHAGSATDPADGDGLTLTTSSTTLASLDGAGDFDLYSIPAIVGESLSVVMRESAVTPAIEPYVALYGPGGALIDSTQGGATAAVEATTTAAGTYTVLVFDAGADESGDYELQFTRKSNVVGRMIFYNNSSFDAAGGDDAAVAPDKVARLPGQAAGFVNAIGFTRGINGVMADVAQIPGQILSASDFTFKVGADGNPAAWAAAPAPASVAVRKGEGRAGSDRVVITWPDNSIRNQWLQVTVLANGVTNLRAADVFYFGSLVGDTGDSALRVNALDLASVKRALNTTVPIAAREDMTRDGRVNALDLAAVRGSLNRSLGAIVAAAAGGAWGAVPLAAESAATSRRLWDEAPAGLLDA